MPSFRKLGGPSKSGRTQIGFLQAPEQELTKCFPAVLEIMQAQLTMLEQQAAETR